MAGRNLVYIGALYRDYQKSVIYIFTAVFGSSGLTVPAVAGSGVGTANRDVVADSA